MTQQQLIETLQNGERLTLEAKLAKSELPKSVWETYSAFANTIGGTILLGVNEQQKESNQTKRFSIQGVENPQKLMTDFWNIKLPVEQIYEGGMSKARNPRIQNMLRMIGFGENLGSGFPLILSAWNQVGWKEPVLENKMELDEVALTLFVYDKTAQTSAQTSDGSLTGSLSSGLTENKTAQTRKEQVFQLIKERPTITIGEMAQLLGRGKRTIQDYINKLKAENRIRRVGSATLGGKWEIVGEETEKTKDTNTQ